METRNLIFLKKMKTGILGLLYLSLLLLWAFMNVMIISSLNLRACLCCNYVIAFSFLGVCSVVEV